MCKTRAKLFHCKTSREKMDSSPRGKNRASGLDFKQSPSKSAKRGERKVWNRVFEFSIEGPIPGGERVGINKYALSIPLYSDLREQGTDLMNALKEVALQGCTVTMKQYSDTTKVPELLATFFTQLGLDAYLAAAT